MGLNVHIQDARTGRKAPLNNQGIQPVEIHPHPPQNDTHRTVPQNEFLTNNGSNDMRVVGSLSSPVDFAITSKNDNDIFISELAIFIAKNGVSLNQFGAGSALVNGIQCIIASTNFQGGEIILADNLKTNLDLIRFARFNPSFGSGNDVFLLKNSVGVNIDAYAPVVDFNKIYNLDWGIRIPKNSTDKLIIRIRDDITTYSLDEFDIEASFTELLISN